MSALCVCASGAGRTILAIGAHAGDMELTCGALLAKHTRLGDRVVLLHLSLGERGKPGTSPEEYGAQKRREAEAAAKALGAEVRFGPWKDGDVPQSDDVARWVAEQIKVEKPTTVITHWKNSIHKDHAAAYVLANNAVLFAAIEGTRTVKAVYFTENWEDAEGFQPYIYAGFTEEDCQSWRKAVLAYEFTHAAFSGFDYIRYYEGMQKVRGAQARQPFAIAFDVEAMSKRRVIETLP